MQDATLGGCSRLPFPLWQPDHCTGPSASPLLLCARAPHAHTACWAQRALRAGEARLGSRDSALIFAELRPGGGRARLPQGNTHHGPAGPCLGWEVLTPFCQVGNQLGAAVTRPGPQGQRWDLDGGRRRPKLPLFQGSRPPLGPVGIFSPESPERPEGTGCRVQLMEAKGPHAFCG